LNHLNGQIDTDNLRNIILPDFPPFYLPKGG
jgi:hypothetical protein